MIDTIAIMDTFCSELAQEAIREYYKELTPVQYLHGDKDDKGVFHKLYLCRHSENMRGSLVIAEHIPRNLNRSQLTRWLADMLRSLPVWPAITAAVDEAENDLMLEAERRSNK